MHDDDRQLNLPKREEKILEFWERNRIFEKSLEKTKGNKPFVFYEGPPTANGSPGFHHFEARAFKDLIPRYKTMRGFYVERKAGWDTHGLPVEIQVEKELGFKTKREIEKFGIARFNAKCREAVWRYKEEWDRFTKRIGFWLDTANPYITYETSYIESLWWIIKEFWKKKLLYQDFKVVPWCPRCQTALSTHELGLGYETVKDRSVYVRFRVKAKTKEWQNTSILSWTTTPWTLPGNVALAVNSKEDYVCVPDPDQKGHWLVLGYASFKQLLAKKFFPPEIATPPLGARNDDERLGVDRFKGKEMLGIEYEPLFRMKELVSPKSHRVYAADFVTTAEGTGVVHTAVMYGEDDYRLGTKVGLPKFHTVDETGRFIRRLAEGLGGQYVKDPKTEEKIIASLKRRGLLFKEELYEHDYPFCWRCETPILYYARNAWWVKVTAKRKELIANNEKISWVPEHVKHGRFGEFLREVRDWAFSRERYWGTPLPVWKCGKCENVEVVGGLEELSRRAPSSGNRYLAMRHGESEIQMLGIADDDKRSYRLTPRGRKEVEAKARELRKEKIDLIITSPIQRTRETAAILAKSLGVRVITDRRLREIHVGVFEHKPIRRYHEYFSSILEKFTKRPPKGESLNDLKKRLMALMADLEKKYRGKNILLVSHEYPIWILWGASQGLSSEKMAAEKERRGRDFLKTGGVIEVQFQPLPRDGSGEVDLHRPFVDEVKLVCPKCHGSMKRVPEVVDVWFDSGSMPFAQHHYPFGGTRNPKPETRKLPFPADYICEAVDQTRGWFYTLLAVSTLLGRGPSYRNVISLGHVLDKHGQKMSKSKGNVVDPWAMIEKYGTDTIRWYFYTVNAPGDPKRFDERELLLKLRGLIATLWNSYVFFSTYVQHSMLNILNAKPETRNKSQIPNPKHVLDQWVMAKLDQLTHDVTRRLDRYDIVGAARELEDFIVEDFSNWYLRRSRRRFQRPQSAREKAEAARITGYVLLRLVTLMAPFTPFLAETVYQELRNKIGLTDESVHLRKWPVVSRLDSQNKALIAQMGIIREVAAMALSERAKAGIKVRQPLASFQVPKSYAHQTRSAWTVKSERSDGVDETKWKLGELFNIAADEANVKAVIFGDGFKLDTVITPELREEGLVREIVRHIQELRRDAGLKPVERVRVEMNGDRELEALIDRWQKLIKQETGAVAIELGGKQDATTAREVNLDGKQARLGIRRV